MAPVDLTYLPDVFSCAVPESVLEIPEAERPRRAPVVDDNFMLVDGRRAFIRCRLPLTNADANLTFAYVCWVEVTRESYEMNRRLWRERTTRAMIKVEGTLANALPPFEDELGCSVTAGVRDWQAPNPVVVEASGAGLGYFLKPPGLDLNTHLALLGEVLREDFARAIESKLSMCWGYAAAYEEFETEDWLRAPRRQVIAEFEPQAGEPWRYCTLGLSARPMPGGQRVEFAWEVPRRITDGAVFRTMATIAAQPWHLKVGFFDGYVFSVPGGFPPGSDFKYALCYDAARAYSALEGLAVFELPVKILMPLPILERERSHLRPDETRYLDLKDYLR